MKGNLIATKAIAQQTPEQWTQAIAEAKLSKALERTSQNQLTEIN